MICGVCGGSGWHWTPGNTYYKCHNRDCVEGVTNMRVGSLLFVYGTLRRGERADLSKNEADFDVKYLGEDIINAELYHLGGFPGVKNLGEGAFEVEDPCVHGDVFEIKNESIITILDHYEGYPYLYNRAETETADGRRVWVYTYNGEVVESQRIVSGDWVNRPKMNLA